MAIRTLYRIDERAFAAGEAMTPPGDHISSLKAEQQTAEVILRRAAGVRERVRADLIFTFDNLAWTKRYFTLKSNRTIYELAVDEKDIVHSADMELFNAIAEINADTPEAQALAARSWQSDKGDGQRVEHLCAAAWVTAVLYTPHQKRVVFNEIYRVDKREGDDDGTLEQLTDQFRD
jgi:hypothetical protein